MFNSGITNPSALAGFMHLSNLDPDMDLNQGILGEGLNSGWV